MEEYPEGIPRLSAFLDSDDSFKIFRKFGKCHTRLLLHLQFEIDELSKELNELDRSDAADENMEYRLQGVEHAENWDNTQQDLLHKIKVKLFEYGDTCQTEILGIKEVRNS